LEWLVLWTCTSYLYSPSILTILASEEKRGKGGRPKRTFVRRRKLAMKEKKGREQSFSRCFSCNFIRLVRPGHGGGGGEGKKKEGRSGGVARFLPFADILPHQGGKRSQDGKQCVRIGGSMIGRRGKEKRKEGC